MDGEDEKEGKEEEEEIRRQIVKGSAWESKSTERWTGPLYICLRCYEMTKAQTPSTQPNK